MLKSTSFDKEKMIINLSYQIGYGEINILKHLIEEGYIEFRDGREDLDSSESFSKSKCWNLSEIGLIETDDMAWHTTFHLTDAGKKFVAENNIREMDYEVITPKVLGKYLYDALKDDKMPYHAMNAWYVNSLMELKYGKEKNKQFTDAGESIWKESWSVFDELMNPNGQYDE